MKVWRLVLAGVLLCSHANAGGPCDLNWLPGQGTTPLQGVLCATTWDPDGDGPQPAALVTGGTFTSAGGVSANRVARWNGVSWEALGSGVSGGLGEVRALTTWDPDGDGPAAEWLVAAGSFTQAGGGSANNIAIWDGSAWLPLGLGIGGGVTPRVRALASWDADGDGPAPSLLVAGGTFTTAGGASAFAIAAWSPATQAWSPLGSGISGSVYALAAPGQQECASGAGDLVVGGIFSTAGGISASNVARWDGGQWHALGSGASGSVFALTYWDVDGDGPQTEQLIVGGFFASAGGTAANAVARWDGTQWSALGTGVSGGGSASVEALRSWDPDAGGPGTPLLVAGGSFMMAGGVGVSNIARWNGTVWQALGAGTSAVTALVTWDPDASGGLSEQPLAVTALGMTRWDGVEWESLDSGINESVMALTTWDADGGGPQNAQLVVAGEFTVAGGRTRNRIARWAGGTWNSFDSGMDAPVYALCTWDPDGAGVQNPTLVAGGAFQIAGGSTRRRIARWAGSGWLSFGSGMVGDVLALCSWDVDGTGPGTSLLVAGGSISQAGGNAVAGVASWNGAAWSAMGGGVGGVSPIVRAVTSWDPDGAGPMQEVLVAGGDFTTAGGVGANRVAQWNGSAWVPLGAGMNNSVFALTTWDPDGGGPLNEQLVAGGAFTTAGGVTANRIAVWDGSAWSPVGDGFDSAVLALTWWLSDGAASPSQLVAGGFFTASGGNSVSRIAAWNGVAWEPLSSGVDAVVRAVTAWDPDGAGDGRLRLCIGGDFILAGGLSSGYFAQWGLASSVWGLGQSGLLSGALNWACGSTPTFLDRAVVDNTLAGYAASAFTMSLADNTGDLVFESLDVRSDEVTLDVRGSMLSLSAPAVVGSDSLRVNDASLTILNTLPGAGDLVAGRVVVGDNASSSAILRASGDTLNVSIAADAVVGRSSGMGELRVEGGAAVTITGDVVVGDGAAGVGIVGVKDGGSVLTTGAAGDKLVLGHFGTATWGIGGKGGKEGADVTTAGRLESVSLGQQPGSAGNVSVAGAGSSWLLDAESMDIGRAGAGSILISNGGLLDTDVTDGVSIARLPGSTGSVTLRGAGSRWTEHAGTVTVGASGIIDAGEGTTVEAPLIEVKAGGVITGGGTIGNVAPAGVIVTGTIDPASDASDSGTLVLPGNLLLCDVDCLPPGACCVSGVCTDNVSGSACFSSGGVFHESISCATCPCGLEGRTRPDTGTLTIDFNSPSQRDQLVVGGSITLGGALVVRFNDGYTPNLTESFTPILAADFVNQFDVAFFPRFSTSPKDDRFMRVVYNSPLENGIGVSLVVDSLSNLLDIGNPSNVSVSGSPNAAALGDLDGDSDLDIAVTVSDPNPSNNGSLFVLTNNGSGSFSVTAQYPTGHEPSAVAIAPIDLTGGNEILVANRGDDTVRVYNNSLGLFAPGPLIATGDEPVDVDPVDLDNDKDIDIVTTNFGAGTIALVINNGAGAFPAPAVNVAAGDEPVDSDPVDLDNDKDIDIVTTNFGSNNVSFSVNDGKGDFPSTFSLPVGDGPFRVETAYLDNNPIPDIMTVDRNGNTVSVLRATGPLTYAPSVQLPVGTQPRSIVAVDLDNDSDLDLAIVATDAVDGDVVQVLRNDSPPGQLALASATNIPAGADPILVLAGNVDNAGGDDLVTINDSLLLGLTTGADNDVSILLNAVPPPPDCAGDTNGDNLVNGADLSVLLGQFGQSVTPGTGADFNNDGVVNGADLSVLLGLFGSSC